MLTVRKVTEEFKLEVVAVRAWLAKLKLPGVNCVRAVCIPAETIEKFIIENTIPARGEQR